MSNEDRIHVIEAGDLLETRDRVGKAATTPITPLTARAPYATPSRTVAYTPPAEPGSSMHFALLIALTWLLGPAALLLTPAGRRRRGWVALGLVAAAAALVLLVVPYEGFVSLVGLATPLAWSALAVLATAGGFSAWARAVHLASASLPPAHRLPRLLRSPAAVLALGLLAPGSGLLASGGRLRAGLWLWLLWPAALGLLVLRSAIGMWQHLAMTMGNSSAADMLEVFILLSAGAVAVGALVWVVQALEGVRRLAPAPALGRNHGDWFAVALGVSCVTLAVGGNPGHVARQLGDAATVLRAEGMTIIPLQLSLVADRLDPSCAEYAVQAIALHEARGDQEQAGALRARLDEGLASYLTLLGNDGAQAGPGSDSSVDPARPGNEDVYYGTLVRRPR